MRSVAAARLTVGNPYIRAGASVTGGRFDDPNTSGIPNSLNYTIYGFDVQARYKKLIRGQFEFARRDSDRVGLHPGRPGVFSEAVQGNYVEAEARPWDECRVSLLLRYDLQTRHSPLPPPGSLLTTGTFNTERLTVGINIELWHSSLLMIDYERWLLPEPDHRTEDVLGPVTRSHSRSPRKNRSRQGGGIRYLVAPFIPAMLRTFIATLAGQVWRKGVCR